MGIPQPYTIRPACREEFPALARIKTASAMRFSTDDIPEPHRSTHTVPEAVLESAITRGMVWAVADGEDIPVGYAVLEENNNVIVLYQVDVLPEHGGRGLGRALVERAVGRARELGYDALYLTTFRHVAWNAPFYAKLGFDFPPERELPEGVLATLAEERAFARGRVAMRKAL